MTAPILSFTPSAQDPEILEELFVARYGLLDSLMADVYAVARGEDRHHRLLLGPRGIGKSHLLALVAHRARQQFTPDELQLAWTPEDLWGLASYADLVSIIVDAIADSESNETTASLPPTSDEDAEAILRRVIRRTPTLLLLENLDDVLRAVGREGVRRLRSTAEDCPLLIVATAPQLFGEIQRASEPLYGFFDVEHLDELTTVEAAELLAKVARLRGDDTLLNFLETDVARRRVEAVAALAGGHPRIWMLFAGCLSVTALDQLVPLFLESLDDLTPYYQSRVAALPRQQQAIVMAICQSAGALSNRDLADRARVGDRQTATALRDLERKGYVRRAQLPKGSKGDQRLSWWELREPLLRLSLDVKQARGRPLRIIVDFLREWYGLRLHVERSHLLGASLGEQYVAAALERPVHLDWASVSTVIDELPSEARGEFIDCVLRDRPGDFATLLTDASAPIAAKLRGAILAASDPGAALVAVEEALERDPANASVLELQGRLLQHTGDPTGAEAALEEALRLSPGRILVMTTLASVKRALHRDEEALTLLEEAALLHGDDYWIHHELGWTLERLERLPEAMAAYEQALALESDNVELVGHIVTLLTRLGRHSEALDRARAAIELAPESATPHRLLGIALGGLGRADEALEALDRAAHIDPDSAEVQFHRGTALLDLGRPDEAVLARKRAAELSPVIDRYAYGHGEALERVGQFLRAIDVYQDMVAHDPDDAHRWYHLAAALRSAGRLDDARDAAEAAVRLDALEGGYWHLKSRIELEAGAVSEAFASIDKAISTDPDNAYYRFALARMQLRLGDYAWTETLTSAVSIASRSGHALEEDAARWCRIVVRLPRADWEVAAQHLVDAFEATSATSLSAAILAVVPMLENDEDVGTWLDAWRTAAGGKETFEISLSILDAAVRWITDRDQAHLLRLSAEQRPILAKLLETRSLTRRGRTAHGQDSA